MPKRNGQIVDKSQSNGRSVQEAWWELFERNEKFWASGDVQKILTDRQLIERMQEWFPGRKARLMRQPSRWRSSYNRKRKAIVVHRYVRDGEGRVARATAHAMPTSQWKRPRSKAAQS